MEQKGLAVSKMAEGLIGSEIIKIAGEVKNKMANGEKIYNFTIGDFDPKIFPIPAELTQEIKDAYTLGETNYPEANGILGLRKQVSKFISDREKINYDADEVVIACGARPIIYAIFRTLVDSNDTVIFPIPSWNNNHYCHMTDANVVEITTQAENNFMPTADELRPHLKGATLIALCSPLNPTGTVFKKEVLEEICDMILAENASRSANEKPLYLMYDQIYWVLTHGQTQHYNPVSLRPAMRNYTVFVDGISKCFAATGLRVGWSIGPKFITDRMRAILSHVGAWAPRAEQIATEKYLSDSQKVDTFLNVFKTELSLRLEALYNGINALQQKGYKVAAIAPQAAIYLTVQFNLTGYTTKDGMLLTNARDVTKFLLNDAKLAVVPFYAFGSDDSNQWYRISVGTCKKEEIPQVLQLLEAALESLSK
ncbi:MAG: pyridoxal phosphate-dependent aminotransferase [Bacteroidia bacterium]|nr:pyridoxal phosphate-dependent aminotransferase [Bacteroidia bacterium]